MSNKNHSQLDLDELLSCAERAARKAGLHALQQRHRRNEVIESFAHDVKLKLDQECQAVAEDVIRRRFSDHGILGEESNGDISNSETFWIIDPIDGTVNYFHGLPLWCCSVAVQQGKQIIAGAVYAPILDECYTAHAEKTAECNGKTITVSQTKLLDQAVVATGLYKNSQDLSSSMELFKTLSMKTQKLRIMGSAALDICHVACGKTDGYYESGIYLWDMAAGSLIVEQAGGHTEILDQTEGHRVRFMAANRHVFHPLKQVLTSFS